MTPSFQKISCTIYIFLCCISLSLLFGQTDSLTKESKIVLSGYIKSLQSLGFVKINNPFQPSTPIELRVKDNLLHNRINLSYYPNQKWKTHLSLRNRIFWSDQILLLGKDVFQKGLSQGNDYLDMDYSYVDEKGIAIHSIIDRAYVEYYGKKTTIGLGRQRVNWGLVLIWNPNDIFNAYSFTDFDYEERPGSDVARMQYYINPTSSLDVAIQINDKIDSINAGILYRFDAFGVAFQSIVGITEGDYVYGGGWNSYIKNVGFSGEFSHFIAFKNTGINSTILVISSSIDYTFNSGLYLNLGLLYNEGAKDTGFNIIQNNNLNFNAKNLYPYRWNLFAGINYSFHPLWRVNFSSVWSPSEDNAWFISPGITCSLSQNFDVDVLAQLFFTNDIKGNYTSPFQSYFMRLKYSF